MAEPSWHSIKRRCIQSRNSEIDMQHSSPASGSGSGSGSGSESLPEHHHSYNHHSTDAEDTAPSGSTKSLSDHVMQAVVENGRRYCNDTYLMPNDEEEHTRISIIHQIYLILLNGQLTQIPLSSSNPRILDVGSGPGDWVLAMGEEYPNSQIIATDISIFDSQPVSIGPPNVYFQIDDAEQEWTYHEPFDFIHARGLCGAISDWPYFYRQAYGHLKPGGAIQIADSDITANSLYIPDAPPNSYLNIFLSAIRSATDIAGYSRDWDHLSTPSLTQAGFTDVRTFDMEVPVGTWPDNPRDKTLGKMALIVLLEGLEAASMRLLTKFADWSVEDVIDLCEKVKMEIVTSVGAMGLVKIVVAEKQTT